MSCNVWEEKGLLYGSKELLDEEIREFEEHLKNCSECAMEWEFYISSKRFFSTEILGESPSEECDKEILRVCSDGRKQVTYLQLSFLSVVLRRTFISIAVFLFGFITVGLISLQIDTIKQQRKIATAKNSVKLTTVDDSNKVKKDSTADNYGRDNLQIRNKKGDINKAGVYPVDLLKDR